jgi:uncharacterized protein YecE (DUF72 family)
LSLPEFLVGTGGWSYFKVPNKPSLVAYSEVFNFVEVNSTFYEYPAVEAVQRWRRTVPSDFTFSVRCHQNLSHNIGFVPTNQAYEVFYHMKHYCDILKSPYLVLETPAKYEINHENLKDAKDFFSSLKFDGLRLVWEYRAPITRIVVDLMEDFGIIQCVDLSRQRPSYSLDVAYSRLFGKGWHNVYQFSDDELAEIDRRAHETNSKTVILSYHGLRMNSDALRFKHYKSTGHFLPVTSFIGVDSARAVLAEDATFPASKAELKAGQGWKVIDLNNDERVHLFEFLDKIADKTYSNVDEVIEELRAMF